MPDAPQRGILPHRLLREDVYRRRRNAALKKRVGKIAKYFDRVGEITVLLTVSKGHGFEGSAAGGVRMNGSSHSNRAVYLYADAVNGNRREFESARYLRVWVDFTGIDFRKASFGLVDKYDELFTTDDIDGRTDLPFYCLAEGESE